MINPLPKVNLDVEKKGVTKRYLLAGIDYGQETNPLYIMVDIQLISKTHDILPEGAVATQTPPTGRADDRNTGDWDTGGCAVRD